MGIALSSATAAAWMRCLAAQGLRCTRSAEVREFVESGTVAEADALRASPRSTALTELVRIHGVGSATAAAGNPTVNVEPLPEAPGRFRVLGYCPASARAMVVDRQGVRRDDDFGDRLGERTGGTFWPGLCSAGGPRGARASARD